METTIFATYKRQQTMLKRQRRLNFLPEALYQATSRPTCDNSIAGPRKQDAQLSQRDRAAGCVIVFAKSRTLERGDNDLRIL